MDALQFEQRVQEDAALQSLVREVAGEAAREVSVSEPQRFVTVSGVDLLFSLAAYALYRWAKEHFDHRRAKGEAEVLQQQEQVIAALIEDGFRPKDAQAAAVALLGAMAR